MSEWKKKIKRNWSEKEKLKFIGFPYYPCVLWYNTKKEQFSVLFCVDGWLDGNDDDDEDYDDDDDDYEEKTCSSGSQVKDVFIGSTLRCI